MVVFGIGRLRWTKMREDGIQIYLVTNARTFLADAYCPFAR